MILEEAKKIKHHNKEIVESGIYYQKDKARKNLKRIEENTSRALKEGLKYLGKKKNVSKAEAEAVFEKIARKKGK